MVPNPQPEALLRTTDLACARGGVLILDGVSIEVRAQSALILRGPNGSGKTTLLRTLAGLQPPVTGELEVDPEEIAYAAHADGVKATLTVEENLAFWSVIYGRRPDLGQVLRDYDLVKLSARPAGTLSAGQKRRLGLARLAVTGRRLWLLDEPTVSLDAASVALFAEAVQRHLTGGGAAILATHIDLGLTAPALDLGPHRVLARKAVSDDNFDEAFL